MSPKEHELNMRILEGSFAVEGITLSQETKDNLKLLASGKVTSEELISNIISKYKRG